MIGKDYRNNGLECKKFVSVVSYEEPEGTVTPGGETGTTPTEQEKTKLTGAEITIIINTGIGSVTDTITGVLDIFKKPDTNVNNYYGNEDKKGNTATWVIAGAAVVVVLVLVLALKK